MRTRNRGNGASPSEQGEDIPVPGEGGQAEPPTKVCLHPTFPPQRLAADVSRTQYKPKLIPYVLIPQRVMSSTPSEDTELTLISGQAYEDNEPELASRCECRTIVVSTFLSLTLFVLLPHIPLSTRRSTLCHGTTSSTLCHWDPLVLSTRLCVVDRFIVIPARYARLTRLRGGPA